MAAEDKKKYASVKAAMELHLISKHNVIFESAHSIYAASKRSSEAFITEVHKLAEQFSFGLLKDKLIRDRIVVRIKD